MIPMSDPIETAELLAFARIVEAKSLSRAADELRVPRATLGRRLARLEERLGTRLLQRTTRSLALTDAGEVFYRHARIVLDAVSQAQASVQQTDDVIRGDLRVSIPPLMDDALSTLITSFAKKHLEVRVQVDVSTRLVDLRRDGYDVALRASSELHPGLIARTIARHKVLAVASPDYLERMGTPRKVKDLRNHRCLTGFARGELPQSSWQAGKGVIRVDGVFSSNDLQLVRAAAVSGLGIAMIPAIVLGDLVATGVLVHVLPGILEMESRISVVYVEREFVPPHVRAFVEAMMKWAPVLQTASL
jgi:DNA-binding transcriptional LysR family regulator